MNTQAAAGPTTNNSKECESTTLRQCMQNSCTKVEECVQKSPQSSMLVSLGAGLGVGLIIGSVLAGSRSTSNSRWFERQAAERLGERFIAQMGSMLPDAISDRFSS